MRLSRLLFGTMCSLSISACDHTGPGIEAVLGLAPTEEQFAVVRDRFAEICETDLSKKVVQPAEGYLKFPYLIPAGYYKQMWDWDGFFMGSYFCFKGKPEHLQWWALNLLEGVDERGYVSGCATTQGPRPIFGDFAMKPFLAQGVVKASEGIGSYDWVAEPYQKLCQVISYREETQQDSDTGLFFWQIAMQSGADNNPALNYYKDDKRSFLACDASAWQYLEYVNMAIIAEKLGHNDDAAVYKKKAADLKDAMLRILWCEDDGMFYNVNRETGDWYKRVSYSCFVPLYAGIPSKEQASRMVNGYLLNEDHMLSPNGLTTLSKQDPDYNNINMITPFSNWQGPVWPIATFIYCNGLKNYGYDAEVRLLAFKMGERLIRDYEEYGSLHECYDAETGAALSPADTYVDKDGRFVGFVSWNLCTEMLLALQ